MIVLVPVCSWIVGIAHVAIRVEPDNFATPLPPRSLTQRTRYRRLLSETVPFMPTKPVEPTSVIELIFTVGAIRSIVCQRQRCACSRTVTSFSGTAPSSRGAALASSRLAVPPLPPPQPATVRQATASAVLVKRVLIPNVLRSCLSFPVALSNEVLGSRSRERTDRFGLARRRVLALDNSSAIPDQV